jgi:hypothetical protein
MTCQKQNFDEIINAVKTSLRARANYAKNQNVLDLIQLISEFHESCFKRLSVYNAGASWQVFEELKDISIKNDEDFRFALIIFVLLQIFNIDRCHQASDFHQYLKEYLPSSLRHEVLGLPKKLLEKLQEYKPSSESIAALISDKQPPVIHQVLLFFYTQSLSQAPDETLEFPYAKLNYTVDESEINGDPQPGQIVVYLNDGEVYCRFIDLKGVYQKRISLPIKRAKSDQENFINANKMCILEALGKQQLIQFLTNEQKHLLKTRRSMLSFLERKITGIEVTAKSLGFLVRAWNWWTSKTIDQSPINDLVQFQTDLNPEPIDDQFLLLNYLFANAEHLIDQQNEKLEALKNPRNSVSEQKKQMDELQERLKVYKGIIKQIEQLISGLSTLTELSPTLIDFFNKEDPIQDCGRSSGVIRHQKAQEKILGEFYESFSKLISKFAQFQEQKNTHLKTFEIQFNFNPPKNLVTDIAKIVVGLALVSASAVSLIYAPQLLLLLSLNIALTLFRAMLGIACLASLYCLYGAWQNYQADTAPLPNNECALSMTA